MCSSTTEMALNSIACHLKSHMEPTRLEFLPYHWLLASVVRLPSFPSFPPIHILSQGQCTLSKIPKIHLLVNFSSNTAQNYGHALPCPKTPIMPSSISALGHQNGCVTLWTPNLPHRAIQLLAHLGLGVSLSGDPSQGGRYMSTAGRDGTVKVWDCRNWKGAVRAWSECRVRVEC